MPSRGAGVGVPAQFERRTGLTITDHIQDAIILEDPAVVLTLLYDPDGKVRNRARVREDHQHAEPGKLTCRDAGDRP